MGVGVCMEGRPRRGGGGGRPSPTLVLSVIPTPGWMQIENCMHVTLVSTIKFKSYLQHASKSHLLLGATWCHLKLFVHVGSISQSNIQCQVAPKSHPRGATWVRLGCDLN